jgi:dipeptidyl-peptidase-4
LFGTTQRQTKRDVLLPAEKLVPTGETKPLAINGYEWSADDKRLLIYTNSKKVWRQNTKGDYWVLDPASGKLTKLGGDAKPSTMMFAKFSPDGTRVGYVRESDLYVENIDTGKDHTSDHERLADDDQRHIRLGERRRIQSS